MSNQEQPQRGRGGVAVDPEFTLLTTDEFVADLVNSIDRATDRVAIQLMTFDGDSAGHLVEDLLVRALGRNVQVDLLVDDFARRIVSDQPRRRGAVRVEVEATLAMLERLKTAGARLQITRPFGPLQVFAWTRNHRKIVVVDHVTYLGGVNISEHNFEWHDFMVKTTSQPIRSTCLGLIEQTFSGQRTVHREGPIVTDEGLEEVFESLIRGAQQSIVLASPYALDFALPELLAGSAAKEKRLVLLANNNFAWLRMVDRALKRQLHDSGVRLQHFPRFSHAKFLIVDDTTLLIGSSNFGRHSFWCNEELGLIITDKAFIAHFKLRMDTAVDTGGEALPQGSVAISRVSVVVMRVALTLYARILAFRNPVLARR